MAQINVIGYVTQDIVPKQSQKGSTYVHFFLKEYIGKGRYESYQIWAWNNIVSKLQRLRIKKGSVIWVSGSLELVDCTVKGGQEQTKMLKVYCKDLGIVNCNPTANLPAESMNAESASPGSPEELDGDRNQLPE